MTDTDRLTAIRERASNATQGPWESDGAEVYTAGAREWVAESLDTDDVMKGELDADFIANARDDVPWLLEQLSLSAARIAQLEAENERLSRQIIDLRDTCHCGGQPAG